MRRALTVILARLHLEHHRGLVGVEQKVVLRGDGLGRALADQIPGARWPTSGLMAGLSGRMGSPAPLSLTSICQHGSAACYCQVMKSVVFGTLSSSCGNGHATLWRGLIRALESVR